MTTKTDHTSVDAAENQGDPAAATGTGVRKSSDAAGAYEPPMIKTFTNEEIMAEIGPAQMCSPSPCPTAP